ncbi:hotdog domain-containing protein [Pyrobaculum neutrophilum]|uniref:acyl-CoA thioesterase n=1 Tax=Pyrobaculum neutrophilum TaxID=70771 RepID=UPI001FE1AD0F|nr:acyl-CoA thioesterase [Pyrobaculum neutrophilum]
MDVVVSSTLVESTRLVSQRHVNPFGALYGGYMLRWVVEVGNVAAMSFVEGDAVLGYLDKMHFLTPARAGDLLKFRAWVVESRRTSVSVLVESYRAGGAELATVGRMVFVKIGLDGRPVPVNKGVRCDAGWEDLCLYFKRWRSEVDAAVRGEMPRAGDDWRDVSKFLAMPEDSVDGLLMDGGRLLFRLDELAYIKAFQFYPATYVTAGVNRIIFRKPIYVGDIVAVKTGVTYVGSTSVEIGFTVEAWGRGGVRHVADGYFTFVNMSEGRPTAINAPPRGDEAARRRKEESVKEAKLLKGLRPPAGAEPWLLQLARGSQQGG